MRYVIELESLVTIEYKESEVHVRTEEEGEYSNRNKPDPKKQGCRNDYEADEEHCQRVCRQD